MLLESPEVVGALIFKMTASRFVHVSDDEINILKENAIPKNSQDAAKIGVTPFKGKI